jgi:ribosome-associated translation inhibitor RaiA
MSPINIEVTARGKVSRRARAEARKKLDHLEGFSKGPVLGARVVLIQEPNPRIPLPARAEAEVNLQGRLVRARAAAPSMEAAVDDVAERLQRQLRRYVDRLVTFEREPATPPPGEWSHHAWSPPRPLAFVHPVEERRIIRRKSFAFDSMSVEQAVDALKNLYHDFFLFQDAGADVDAVVYWRDNQSLGVIEPPWAKPADCGGVSRFSAPIDLGTAIAEMDALRHRFLFFDHRPRQRHLPARRRELRPDRTCLTWPAAADGVSLMREKAAEAARER